VACGRYAGGLADWRVSGYTETGLLAGERYPHSVEFKDVRAGRRQAIRRYTQRGRDLPGNREIYGETEGSLRVTIEPLDAIALGPSGVWTEGTGILANIQWRMS